MTSQAKRQAISGKTGAGPRVGHLDSLTGVLKEMAAVYREMRYKQTNVNEGAKLIFALGTMRTVLETIALEKLQAQLDQVADAIRMGSYGSHYPTIDCQIAKPN